DDLQWADDATLSAITTLPVTLAAHPVLWLLAFRTGHLSDTARTALLRLDALGAQRVTLDPLHPDAVLEVARDELGAEPAAEVVALVDQTGGQPFLLVELLRGLRADGLIVVDDGAARLVAGRSATAVSAVGAGLDRLEPGTVEVLEFAAMLGG